MFYGSYIFRSKLGNGLGNGFDHTREPRAIKKISLIFLREAFKLIIKCKNLFRTREKQLSLDLMRAKA